MKTIKLVILVLLFTMLAFDANAQSGYYSFESYNYPGKFIRHAFGMGELSDFTGTITDVDRCDATFKIVPGLADNQLNCVSFQSFNYPSFYLRHESGRIKLNDSASDNSQLFKEDATFKVVPGLADSGSYSFESYNYPGYYLRHRDGHLWVEENDNSQLFKEDATFKQHDPLLTIAGTWKFDEDYDCDGVADSSRVLYLNADGTYGSDSEIVGTWTLGDVLVMSQDSGRFIKIGWLSDTNSMHGVGLVSNFDYVKGAKLACWTASRYSEADA